MTRGKGRGQQVRQGKQVVESDNPPEGREEPVAYYPFLPGDTRAFLPPVTKVIVGEFRPAKCISVPKISIWK
jgi:hypothetical protein